MICVIQKNSACFLFSLDAYPEAVLLGWIAVTPLSVTNELAQLNASLMRLLLLIDYLDIHVFRFHIDDSTLYFLTPVDDIADIMRCIQLTQLIYPHRKMLQRFLPAVAGVQRNNLMERFSPDVHLKLLFLLRFLQTAAGCIAHVLGKRDASQCTFHYIDRLYMHITA